MGESVLAFLDVNGESRGRDSISMYKIFGECFPDIWDIRKA